MLSMTLPQPREIAEQYLSSGLPSVSFKGIADKISPESISDLVLENSEHISLDHIGNEQPKDVIANVKDIGNMVTDDLREEMQQSAQEEPIPNQDQDEAQNQRPSPV